MKPNLFFIMLFLLSSVAVMAQHDGKQTVNDELYKEIASLDSNLFDAFNRREPGKFKNYISEDLEFYHDKSGLTGYDHTINFMESTAASNSDVRRELVKGSLEVYAVPGYGAIQIGAHRFCHTENSDADCGTFKFVHIWQKKDGQWKITRVVSYGH